MGGDFIVRESSQKKGPKFSNLNPKPVNPRFVIIVSSNLIFNNLNDSYW